MMTRTHRNVFAIVLPPFKTNFVLNIVSNEKITKFQKKRQQPFLSQPEPWPWIEQVLTRAPSQSNSIENWAAKS
jgi:hypothetical protein